MYWFDLSLEAASCSPKEILSFKKNKKPKTANKVGKGSDDVNLSFIPSQMCHSSKTQ